MTGARRADDDRPHHPLADVLNPARYEPRARAFVKLELVAMLVPAVWWLVGGALLVG